MEVDHRMAAERPADVHDQQAQQPVASPTGRAAAAAHEELRVRMGHAWRHGGGMEAHDLEDDLADEVDDEDEDDDGGGDGRDYWQPGAEQQAGGAGGPVPRREPGAWWAEPRGHDPMHGAEDAGPDGDDDDEDGGWGPAPAGELGWGARRGRGAAARRGGRPGGGGAAVADAGNEDGGDGDEEAVEAFTDDENGEEAQDTTAEQLRGGKDIQGIPWDRLEFSRDHYRVMRLRSYRNYTNVLPDEASEYRADIVAAGRPANPSHGGRFYDFMRNSRSVQPGLPARRFYAGCGAILRGHFPGGGAPGPPLSGVLVGGTSTIVHFQLRNLVWATSRNDVFLVHENTVDHWSPVTRKVTPVLDVSGGPASRRLGGVGAVQVSTICIRDDLLAVGGFHGELVVVRLSDLSAVHSGRVTRSENGITNGIELCDLPGGGGRGLLTANNDNILRLYDDFDRSHQAQHTAERALPERVYSDIVEMCAAVRAAVGRCSPCSALLFCNLPGGIATFQLTSSVTFPWAVNYAVVRPGSAVAAVVGDNETTVLTDLRTGGQVAALTCHRDYSFACAWHPGGNLLATGNQDTSAAVWDVRRGDRPLARLVGHMGAIRSVRFSPDGRFLAIAEPADFVHVYDVRSGFAVEQEIDLFGEIAGISFTPHSDAFFVGVADLTYSSLLEFERTRDGAG
ncbi:hypothetical protein FOA52_003041 [Chlamydomonas sp. UWO 241]|nr:hypothetical protein FOA52_003041 [Chlamydomonas sp. UWO 241]